jgi:hypothetical protein
MEHYVGLDVSLKADSDLHCQSNNACHLHRCEAIPASSAPSTATSRLLLSRARSARHAAHACKTSEQKFTPKTFRSGSMPQPRSANIATSLSNITAFPRARARARIPGRFVLGICRLATVDDDLGPVGCELARDGTADALGRAGHKSTCCGALAAHARSATNWANAPTKTFSASCAATPTSRYSAARAWTFPAGAPTLR